MGSLGRGLTTGAGCGPDTSASGGRNPLASLADAVLSGGRGKASIAAQDAHAAAAAAAAALPPAGVALSAAWEADRGLARARAWAAQCYPGESGAFFFLSFNDGGGTEENRAGTASAVRDAAGVACARLSVIPAWHRAWEAKNKAMYWGVRLSTRGTA